MKYILIIITGIMIACTARESNSSADADRAKATAQEVEEVCIGGHIYYIYTSRFQVGPALALKVNDNGLPILCEKE